MTWKVAETNVQIKNNGHPGDAHATVTLTLRRPLDGLAVKQIDMAALARAAIGSSQMYAVERLRRLARQLEDAQKGLEVVRTRHRKLTAEREEILLTAPPDAGKKLAALDRAIEDAEGTAADLRDQIPALEAAVAGLRKEQVRPLDEAVKAAANAEGHRLDAELRQATEAAMAALGDKLTRGLDTAAAAQVGLNAVVAYYWGYDNERRRGDLVEKLLADLQAEPPAANNVKK